MNILKYLYPKTLYHTPLNSCMTFALCVSAHPHTKTAVHFATTGTGSSSQRRESKKPRSPGQETAINQRL